MASLGTCCISKCLQTSLFTDDFHVAQEAAYPRVERDILQIEQFSQRLRSKSARTDPTTEANDANRLLSQEGINPRK